MCVCVCGCVHVCVCVFCAAPAVSAFDARSHHVRSDAILAGICRQGGSAVGSQGESSSTRPIFSATTLNQGALDQKNGPVKKKKLTTQDSLLGLIFP